MEPGLGCSTANGIATLTIRNPAKHNAMTPAMWRLLPLLLSQLASDPLVHVLVLTGAGDSFCAGADISSLRTDTDPRDLVVAAEEALERFPKPALAAISGSCVGGGCALAAACDLRFASRGAVFGVTPARLGIVYPAASTQRLVRLVGPATAKYLLFSAELIGAERALRTGLVDEVLPAGRLASRVAEFAALLAQRSRLTQAAAKEHVRGPLAPDRETYWARQESTSGDPAEGVAAFLERRAPQFRWSPRSP